MGRRPAKPKIIKDVIKTLREENILTDKDEMTLLLLENTYVQYTKAYAEVRDRGQTLVVLDYNKNKKVIINPAFTTQLQLQKELFKLVESLFLTPKSRKKDKEELELESPILNMFKDIIEKR